VLTLQLPVDAEVLTGQGLADKITAAAQEGRECWDKMLNTVNDLNKTYGSSFTPDSLEHMHLNIR